MKIEWLDADMTRARLVRGLLWWKRIAVVERDEKGTLALRWSSDDRVINWRFDCGVWCDADLDADLDSRRKDERTWRRPSSYPQARLLRGAA